MEKLFLLIILAFNLYHQKAKTREQREAEVIPKLSEALRHGIGVMDNAFVTLELTTERKYYNYESWRNFGFDLT